MTFAIPYIVFQGATLRFLILEDEKFSLIYLFIIYAPHSTFFDRNIHTVEGGSLTEGKNLLYLLDMRYKVYKMNFSDKIDKKKN